MVAGSINSLESKVCNDGVENLRLFDCPKARRRNGVGVGRWEQETAAEDAHGEVR